MISFLINSMIWLKPASGPPLTEIRDENRIAREITPVAGVSLASPKHLDQTWILKVIVLYNYFFLLSLLNSYSIFSLSRKAAF